MLTHSFIFLLNNEECIKTKGEKPITIGKLAYMTTVSLATTAKKYLARPPIK